MNIPRRPSTWAMFRAWVLTAMILSLAINQFSSTVRIDTLVRQNCAQQQDSARVDAVWSQKLEDNDKIALRAALLAGITQQDLVRVGWLTRRINAFELRKRDTLAIPNSPSCEYKQGKVLTK